MGNENSSESNYRRRVYEQQVQEESINKAVDVALQKQRELYDKRYRALLQAQAQELDKKRNESIEQAIKALDQQKSKYEAKYNELLQTQTPQQNLDALNRNIEQLQQTNTNSLYPSLEMTNNAAPHPAYYSPSTSTSPQTFTYSASAPVSPDPVQTHQSATNNLRRYPVTNLNQIGHDASIARPPVPPTLRFPAANLNLTKQPRPDTSMARPPVPPTQRFPAIKPFMKQRPDTTIPAAVPQFQNRNQFQPNRKTSNQAPDCKTCYSKLGELIFQCKNGHSSCRTCRIRNLNCGDCRNPITDMRNITLEGLIADLVLAESTANQNYGRTNCPYAGDGCSLSFKKEDMESHMKECPFKEMDCPLACVFNIRKCSWRGKINQIVSHFNDVHPEHCVADVDKEMTLLNTSDNHRIVYFTTLGPFHFLVHVKVDNTKNCIFMTTQLIGTKISAAKWTYQIHVYNKQQPKRKYQFNDSCHSNSTPVEQIFDDFNCAVITSDSVKSFSANNRMTYKFYLTKNTEGNVDSKPNNSGPKNYRSKGKFQKGNNS